MDIWHKAKLLKKVLTNVSDAKTSYKFNPFDKGWINERNAKDFIVESEHCQSFLALLPQMWN